MSSDDSLYLSAGLMTGTFMSSSFLINRAVEKQRAVAGLGNARRAILKDIYIGHDPESWSREAMTGSSSAMISVVEMLR